MIDKNLTFITKSEEETRQVAENISKMLSSGDIVCFFAEMGAGKTIFTQGLCRGLGFEGYVNSPSYIIMNSYKAKDYTIYHYDLYRIGSSDELYELGFYDFLGKDGNICIVEWAELAEAELPEKHIEIKIKILSSDKREISVTPKV